MDDRVLVVDDEETLRIVISQVLQADGFEVTTAASGEEAFALFRADPFSLVITDIVMGKMSGIDLLERVKSMESETNVIVMTSHASVDTAVRALRNGAYDYLVKPFDDIELISAVARRARDARRLMDQNRILVEQLKITTAELQSINVQLREAAIRDGLTGLFNHRCFRERLDAELKSSERSGAPVSVVLVDVDHFKHFNDLNGHLAGDECLRFVARCLETVVSQVGIAARYGGEEFVLVLPGSDAEAGYEVAERLRVEIERADIPQAQTQPLGRLTVSAGVSTSPSDGENANALIERADERLYAAKSAGRNNVQGPYADTARTGTDG
ncbi:MAG: diguanylate cyclase [Candidatus Eisenbacteria bacterium]|uniref:Diguanylate cyclase n=1 Tax=Eiseniibacteriota bacterium TaxID=2212470 RepID=A0A956NEN4_UNCEI|nr:diguanylate cyclase [Candidatus Eisenbacteria bacterium]MCB9464126.1 diguanylate cyclase [Candidatus Eisenbacteria bacterium]